MIIVFLPEPCMSPYAMALSLRPMDMHDPVGENV